MTSARQRAWIELGRVVNQALPRNGSGNRPDAAAIRTAAKAVGLTRGDAMRAHSAYMLNTQIDLVPPRLGG